MIGPQALRIAIPPTVGFSVQVIKGTALASVIGFIELTKAGTMITNATFRPFTVYACVALMYFALCFPISAWSRAPRKEAQPWPLTYPRCADRPIAGLRKRFGANEVLKGIDLAVQPGEVVAIIGKSGSGKSTLLRCINGLETFQEGALQVDGQPLLHGNAPAMRALRQHVGMVFQSFNLFPHLSVGRNVMLAPDAGEGRRRRCRPKRRRAQLLARVGLAEKFDAWPDQLSGGQQQRVAIARALAMEPGGAAVRRDHLGARPRTGGRGAARGGVARRRGHDAADGHARDELRAQGRPTAWSSCTPAASTRWGRRRSCSATRRRPSCSSSCRR